MTAEPKYLSATFCQMISLNEFDFGPFDDASPAFDYKEIPHEHLQLITELESAARNKDLSAVTQTYTMLRVSHARASILSQPGSAFTLAVESGSIDTVQYLLSQGVLVSGDHVRTATTMGSRAILQLFLDNGWPINERLGCSYPPALACV